MDVLRGSVLNWKNQPVDVAPDYHRLCAVDAIQQLLRRGITDNLDLIAICGNLCNYRIRLDTSMVRKARIGLSVGFFALALLNGDLSLVLALNHNTPCSITDQFKALPSNRISDAPTWPDRYEGVLLDCEDLFACRVRPPILLLDGLLIKGILWHVEYANLGIIRKRYIQHEDFILRRECPDPIVRQIFDATRKFLREKNETALIRAIEHKMHGMAHLVYRIIFHHGFPIAVSEDPAMFDCRLLLGTARQYGHRIVNSKGKSEDRSPLSDANEIMYIFTPYLVLIEQESHDEMPQFLLIWWISSVQTTPTTTHLFSHGWPSKTKADERSFFGDARKLVTSPSPSKKTYQPHCFQQGSAQDSTTHVIDHASFYPTCLS
jgi:hypothetical protein